MVFGGTPRSGVFWKVDMTQVSFHSKGPKTKYYLWPLGLGLK